MRWNAESIMDAQRQNLAADGCVDAWEVIRSDADSLLYKRTAVACPGYLHDYEIGRILVGDWFMWWSSYRIRNVDLTEGERSELIGDLMRARVVN
jgi:hypothetical protein